MSKKGFTLIEVVASVVIIAVLAGIAGTSYVMQKRRSEYSGMRATVMALAAAVKNRFYATSGVALTANTLATNTQYLLGIRDANFFNYRVIAGAPFSMSVQYAPRGTLGDFTVTNTYIFNSNAVQTSCAGANCLS